MVAGRSLLLSFLIREINIARKHVLDPGFLSETTNK